MLAEDARLLDQRQRTEALPRHAETQETREQLPPNSNFVHVVTHMQNDCMTRHHAAALRSREIRLEDTGWKLSSQPPHGLCSLSPSANYGLWTA